MVAAFAGGHALVVLDAALAVLDHPKAIAPQLLIGRALDKPDHLVVVPGRQSWVTSPTRRQVGDDMPGRVIGGMSASRDRVRDTNPQPGIERAAQSACVS